MVKRDARSGKCETNWLLLGRHIETSAPIHGDKASELREEARLINLSTAVL